MILTQNEKSGRLGPLFGNGESETQTRDQESIRNPKDETLFVTLF